MKRVIYSIYVDVPAKEHYGQSKHIKDTAKKASITVKAFKEHYKKLIESKRKYAEAIGATFIMFENDNRYLTYEKNLRKDFPELTGYEIINFYKIHLLYELAKKYDEILYLDFDVVPVTKDSFFDIWDIQNNIAVYNNNTMINKKMKPITELDYGIRSPSGKYYNCQAMLIAKGRDPNNDVINTGIIGASKEQILKLDFFGDFKDTLDLMTKLRYDKTGLYPQNIIDMFRYDNETIFSYKIRMNNINIQWLDRRWHYFFDYQHFIPKETKLVHVVCKKFDIVWRYYEKYNL
tara:strand:- start:125 stop:997 length:873 start_codon:yes stop_codon:yes gene_type:complete